MNHEVTFRVQIISILSHQESLQSMKADFECELEEKEKEHQITINQLKNDHIQNIEVCFFFF